MSYYDNDEDWMELDGGLVPVGEGRWLDKNTGYTIDENGIVYDSTGEIVDADYYGDDERE